MSTTTIYQDQSIMLVVKSVADADAVNLLKDTFYGTEGIRYRQTGQAYTVTVLYNPFFFHLYVDGALQGIYCLDHRIIDGQDSLNAFYGRYLSVAKAHQRKGYGRLLKTEAVKYIQAQFPKPFIFYSYVEAKNTRSLVLSQQLDFTSIAMLKTFVFRKLNPVVDKRFARLTDQPRMLSLLNGFYTDYSLTVLTKVFAHDNYFVLTEGDTILAGIHGKPTTWQFAQMPGFIGWLMMNTFSRLPLLKKLFQPTYTFLALEGLYLAAGYEELLPVLIESILSYFKLHTAILQIDSKNGLIDLLRQQKGFISGFQKGVSTHVLVKPIGLTDSQMARLQHGPIYISSFDFT